MLAFIRFPYYLISDWLIFMSRIDSYSHLPQFHFMNIIPIRKYINLTNIIPIHKYFSKYSSISYSYIVCPVNFSNEKYIRVKKKKFVEIFWEKIDIRNSWIIRKYFPSDKYYSYSYWQVLEFTNYSYSYSYRSWLRESIPILFCGKKYYLLITDMETRAKLILKL